MMGTVRDENPDEKSMSDLEFENSEEGETDDDDDDDGKSFSDDLSDDGQSDSSNQDRRNAEEVLPQVVARKTSLKNHQSEYAVEKLRQDKMSEGGSDTGMDEETLELEHADLVPGPVKRRRLHAQRDSQRAQNLSWENLLKLHDQDWDDESDDEEWSAMDAIILHWFCTNCTMPNLDKLSICARCGENRNSGILLEGHLAPSTVPVLSAVVPDVGPYTKASGKDSSSRVFPVDSRTDRGKTVIGFDERMLLHDEGSNKSHPHPERSDRLRAIVAGLAAEGLFPGRCALRPAREVSRAELEKVHSPAHVDSVEETCNAELSYFTTDTYANKNSSLAARLAAGISADLATAIVKGEAQNGFALVRPPGHHAEEQAVMGFCLHNNASVAAKAAQAAGAKKVLIVDWDVHHGNGTQDIFEDDPSVLFISLHRHEGGTFYPGTGAASEVGSGKGEGSSINIPWICGGIGDDDYFFAFLHIVLPIARQFAPDMTIISAGFDAARGDPLGGCEVTPSGYAHMTSMLSTVSGGKILVVLEGGYNLRSISASAAAVIKVLLGDSPGSLPNDVQPTEAGAVSMLDVFAIQSQYWPTLHMPEFMRHVAQLATSNSPKRGRRLKRRRYVGGGPVWWKWGRRRIVYHFWCLAMAHKKRLKSKHGGVL